MEKKIENILKNYAEDIVIVTDRDGYIVWVNDWFTRLTKYSFEEVLGKKPASFLQGEESSKSTIKKMREAISVGQKFNVNIVNYSKAGRKYWLNINCSPIYDDNNEVEYFLAIERDITSEYDQNQSRLNRLIEEQQKLSSEKSELIELMSVLAHDLKAPLNNIEGLLEVVGVEDEDIISMLRSEISRSRALISKILSNDNNDSTKISLDLSEFSIPDIIKKLSQINKSGIDSNKLKINISAQTDIKLYSDEILTTLIIENLFINAIKYSRASSQIDFKLTEKGDDVCIEISNETDVLENWQLSEMFKPFQNFSMQLTNKSSGIGSYIVKKYLDILGGKIKVFKLDDRVFFQISIKNANKG